VPAPKEMPHGYDASQLDSGYATCIFAISAQNMSNLYNLVVLGQKREELKDVIITVENIVHFHRERKIFT